MSSTPAIDAAAPIQATLSGRSRFRLPSPPVMVALLMACVFLLRLPSALVPRELNPDEGLMLSQAMKFLVDPRPWLSGDTGNAGPLNSYLVSAFLLVGSKPTFVLVHILGSILICLQVLTGYLTVRRLGTDKTATIAAGLIVLFYGIATDTEYLHYSTELLPILFLMLGFYAFITWLELPGRGGAASLFFLFLGAMSLGTAPWCKLQSGPIAGAIGLIWFAAIFRARGTSLTFSWRVKELIALSVGSFATTGVMLAILVKTGAFEVFWQSYIRGALVYAGPADSTSMFVNFWVHVFAWPYRQPLLVGVLGMILLVRAAERGDIQLFFKQRKWAAFGLLAYVSAAVFAMCKPHYVFGTYEMFVVTPLVYLATAPTRDLAKTSQQGRNLLVFGAGIVLLFCVFVDGARYLNMIRFIRQESFLRQRTDFRAPEDDINLPLIDHSHGKARVEHLLTRLIAPCNWPFKDSNERIAAVVRNIQETHTVRSLAVWGWAPGVYVLTGMPTATRYPIAPVGVKDIRAQNYYWTRFLDDMRQRPPDLFVDAVTPNAFMWQDWTEEDGYESDAQLRQFIDENYTLVDRLTLVKGAKPVRFFARKAALHPE